MDTWRLLLHSAPARGAWNMAVDEAILEFCGDGTTLPTLRFYAWAPPCLSLGYAQPLSDVDLPRLAARGWDLVRRPTGGRAVLHADELTYSVIGPLDEPHLTGGVLASYQRLADVMAAGLAALGLSAELHSVIAAGTGRNTNPVCFEVPSTHEISVAGRKLIGSAQARRREGILQHGSLPLSGDLRRILQVLSYPDEAARSHAAARLLERAATVESLLGYPISWEQAAWALADAFRDVLQLDLQPGELTRRECERAILLAETKYTHPKGRGNSSS